MVLKTVLTILYLWHRLEEGSAEQQGLGSPLRVAQCRAKCLYTFSGEDGGGDKCAKNTECQSCWDQCQMLGTGWSANCDQLTICGSGCRLACRSHLQLEVQRSPVLVTRGEEVIQVSGDCVSWPPISPSDIYVFVVMCRLPDDSWTQVAQTTSLSWRVPTCRAVRVMVVGRDGLVTVYSPAPRPLQEAGVVVRSLGRSWPAAAHAPSPPHADQNTVWRLRQVSLIHQRVLVIAEVSWEPQLSPWTAQIYLVTWTLAGGGLKGNLLTDSTCVTLSLWPDTVYNIQVQLVREPHRVSELLTLDTRRTAALHAAATAPHQPLTDVGHPGFEAVAGAAAAITLFAAVLLLISGRSRAAAGEKPAASVDSSDHFKLFPPPVRLLVEDADVSAATSSGNAEEDSFTTPVGLLPLTADSA